MHEDKRTSKHASNEAYICTYVYMHIHIHIPIHMHTYTYVMAWACSEVINRDRQVRDATGHVFGLDLSSKTSTSTNDTCKREILLGVVVWVRCWMGGSVLILGFWA